jgi:hypothetical protein
MTPSEVMLHNAEMLRVFISPILVYKRGETNAAKWLTGGTILFARHGLYRFLVTAEHIFSEIEKLRNGEEIVIMLGGIGCEPVDITRWKYIDRDDFVDICTVEVPNDFNASCLNKEFFDLLEWPHPRGAPKESAMIIGYPSAHRSVTERSVEAKIIPICDFVTDAGPRRFTVADECDERELLLDLAQLGVPAHFGGMSGSPVFRLVENARPDFIGVFTGGSDGMRGAFFCSHSDFILPSGLLDWGRIPPR